MDDLIYLVCVCLRKESGGMDYDPVVDINAKEPKLLAGEDLLAVQKDNLEYISGLQQIADTIIIPLPMETFNKLADEFNSLIKEVDDKVTEAAKNMVEAYKLMGIQADLDTVRNSMLLQTAEPSAGKVLNEELEIVDRASDYIQLSTGSNDDEDDGYVEETDDCCGCPHCKCDCDCDEEDDYEDDEEDYDDDEDDEEDYDEDEGDDSDDEDSEDEDD